MSLTVNVNGLTLCHKGSDGISAATLPDMCKTPSPGGPVPVAYPNVAKSSDLSKGTTTVAADGGNMCANFGSELSRSTGDEPGSIGGVKSGTFIKEATWISYSFDVKLEAKGACRLTDKMFHNHQNTVNQSGLIQRILGTSALLQDMVCDCDKEVGKGTANDTCLSLGAKKHDCMERKKADHNVKGRRPKLDGERGYNFKTGKPDMHRMRRADRFRKLAELRKRVAAAKNALKAAKTARRVSKATRLVRLTPAGFIGGLIVDAAIDMAVDKAVKEISKLASQADDIAKSLKDTVFPDGAVRGPGGKIDGFFEYKFGCPPGVKSGRGVSTGDAIPDWSPGQQAKMKDLLAAIKANDPSAIDPEAVATLLTNATCS
jgi:hypothetical protein